MVFAITKMNHDKAFAKPVPIPGLKPVSHIEINTISPSFNLDLSASAEAGQYRRLRLDNFLVTAEPGPNHQSLEMPASDLAGFGEPNTPAATAQFLSTPALPSPRKAQEETALLNLNIKDLAQANATHASLPSLSQIGEFRFIDRVIDMAEASPIQPDSRGCGPLNHSLNAAPKYSKVRSVGMERQITGRTSIGIEFVYKDGCYKKAVAPMKAVKMPGDDGVNLRVNMRF